MKTPKVDTPKPKLKFNTPKSGIVRKSLGNNSTASLKKLSTKSKEQVLSMVRDNEENVEIKNKTPKKGRMSLPANVLRSSKSSPENNIGAKTPKKLGASESPKSGKKNTLTNKTPAKNTPISKPKNLKKTPQTKIVSEDMNTPSSVENNTSPIKKNADLKQNKVPFNLDDSLSNKSPNGLQQNKRTSQGRPNPKSPEVELGLQLEEALSPKSKKENRKKMSQGLKLAAQGKSTVNKNLVNKLDKTINSTVNPGQKKKKRRRNRNVNKKSVEPKPSFLKQINAMNAVKALLKSSKPPKADLLSADNDIYLQFNLLKQSPDARGVYKVLLPHCILPHSPEVCLIVPDLKGKRNEPNEAIDHYKQLLKNNDINSITEIIPLRKLKQEYSQFEERRKLTNRFDCIISDGRITHIAQLGKRFARAKKCICPINFNSKTLKEDIARALRKVAIFSSGKGTSFSVKCGRRDMSAEDIADNIVSIGEFLANNETLIGEPLNISLAAIKTSLSSAFPVYVSTATPNDVQKPKGKQRKIEDPVEDEVTTVQDATVVVYPSGNVKLKKRKNEENKENADAQQKSNKKAKTCSSKKVKVKADSSDDDSVEYDSDDMDLSNEDGSEVDSLNGTDDEASDESDVIDEDVDDDDEQSIDEEEIEAAEKAYLEELRELQEEIGKGKIKKSGKAVNIVGKKKDQVTPQNKNPTARSGKKLEKKSLQNQQKQIKKHVLKEQDTVTKGKKVDKHSQQKGKVLQFVKGKGPNKGPGGKNKN